MVSHIRDIFVYKELLLNFAVKELKVKYKNSVLGFFWSLLNPILTMLVFTVVFSVFFPLTGVDNFPIFLLAGLLPWNFFNATVMGGAGSIIANAGLVKKIYFPRELLPASIALANMINFFLELLVFLLFLTVTGIFAPHYFAVFRYLPYLIILLPILFFFSIGIGLLVAALNVYFRDIQHIIGIVLMILFYASPIIYPLSQVPPKYVFIYKLNPLVSMVLSFKNSLYEMKAPQFNWIAYSLAAAFLAFIAGYLIFLRLAPDFAEEL